MCEVPKVVAFSRSCFESWPIGSSFRKYTFGSDVMMWKCFESGRRFKNVRTTRLWIHHATFPVRVAAAGPATAQTPAAAEPRQRRPARVVGDERITAQRRRPAPVVEEPGDHDRPDEREDDVRLPVRVRAEPILGGRVAVESRRMGHEPAAEREE